MNRGGRRRTVAILALATTALGLGLSGSARAQTEGARAVVLSLDGVVDPFVASYVESGIERATDEGAVVVILTIDTPGGLDSSMRQIDQAMLNSGVPVVAFVAPPGARAASAGTFILIASHVAVMAPGTNVGAAHPVGLSGAVASEKAENDAAAYIRSLAQLRGRNADWAESAVRSSVSASAEEALDLNVIDLIAPDIPSLLRDIDGRTVEVVGGQSVVVETTGLTVDEVAMGWGVGLLHALLDPSLAFIFFWLGLAFIATEFFVPGGVVGTLGAIMLVLSVVALGMLPVELTGLVLLIASVVFFLLEFKIPGLGISSAGGVITLVLGGMFLFDRAVPSAQVSLWVILPVAILAALFFLVVVRAAIKMRGRKSAWTQEALVGAEGTVVRALDPTGVALIKAEEWTAESQAGPVPVGARVRVVEVAGLRLKVVPVVDPREAVTPVTGWGTAEGT